MIDLRLADQAADKATLHAQRCRQCGHRIIDDEGNPGYFSEACKPGLALLIAYCDAIDEPVPTVYRTIGGGS